MDKTRELLAERRKFLLQLEKETEHHLTSAPEGTLRISRNNGKVQYYHRKEKSSTVGTYIPRKNRELAAALAQKNYNEKLLSSIQEELEAINAFFTFYPKYEAEEVFDGMNEERRKLIKPLIEPDEVYVQRWQSIPYKGKAFDDGTPGFLTDKGEKVRSKSEMIIANQLARAGVPYRYEYPLRLKGFGTVYPDFMVLNVRKRKEMFWEHQGMMDDENYAEKAIHKTILYEKNGFYPGETLILTSETKNCPIDIEQVIGIIQHFLK